LVRLLASARARTGKKKFDKTAQKMCDEGGKLSLPTVTTYLAFENQQRPFSRIPQSEFQTNRCIEISSTAFPERSVYATSEIIVAAKDHGYDEKFVLPVPNNAYSQNKLDSKPQSRADRILQVHTPLSAENGAD
jgi:hypothetical protein